MNNSMYSDTIFSSKRAGKSVHKYSCDKIFATEFGCIKAHPMKSKRYIYLAFKKLSKNIGVPTDIIMYGSKAQVEGENRKVCERVGCTIDDMEKITPSSNIAE